MRKVRSYAEIYNDLDGEVVNLFKVVRDRGEDLRRALELTPFARAEYRESYDQVVDPVDRARRLLIRSFMGFGSDAHNRRSGFRGTSNRSGTTPAHDWHHYPDSLPLAIERLRGVVIENRAATEVLTYYDSPEALHYIDPPYPHSTRGGNHAYAFEMTDEQHVELAETVRGLRGAVIVSTYPSPLYERLYEREPITPWRKETRVSLADGARKRLEVLYIRGARG